MVERQRRSLWMARGQQATSAPVLDARSPTGGTGMTAPAGFPPPGNPGGGNDGEGEGDGGGKGWWTAGITRATARLPVPSQ